MSFYHIERANIAAEKSLHSSLFSPKQIDIRAKLGRPFEGRKFLKAEQWGQLWLQNTCTSAENARSSREMAVAVKSPPEHFSDSLAKTEGPVHPALSERLWSPCTGAL